MNLDAERDLLSNPSAPLIVSGTAHTRNTWMAIIDLKK